ncbi:NADPH-dependent F420 reductase [Streptomyces sp. NPDC088766]|uniref:NADPH-dependent F420 reductase n=1 Tax=Streptomyces sp. NPDC088766 TaxID=3365893 RepID=UPI0038236DA3
MINATPGAGSPELLGGLRAELAGKILVDVSNATRDADGLPGDLCCPGGSLAERLQAALPDTRVVKTLNTMVFTVMTAPESPATPPTVFVSGDDAHAERAVTGLLGDLGRRPGPATRVDRGPRGHRHGTRHRGDDPGAASGNKGTAVSAKDGSWGCR